MQKILLEILFIIRRNFEEKNLKTLKFQRQRGKTIENIIRTK